MRKLIRTYQKNLIECDYCDYVVPNETNDPNTSIIGFLNKPCPKCGNNLLTETDYYESEKTMVAISWLNKWFSWLTFFYPERWESKSVVDFHDGVKITKMK
jgi:hypothetical protein